MLNSDPLVWEAKWISLSPDPREDIGVFGFRRKFDREHVPSELWVRISADQRYKLYVNGEFVGFGPQRGDPQHWFYETYDLAPFLKEGENWIAALVWNFGRWAPMAQISARTGFVAEFGFSISDFGLERTESEGVFRKQREPDSENSAAPEQTNPKSKIQNPKSLATPHGWQVARLPGWSFDMLHSHHMDWYIDVGPGEVIDFRGAPWGWREGREPEGTANWKEPNVICQAEERGASGGGTPWMLIPRSLPPMRYGRRRESPVGARGFIGDQGVPEEEISGLVSDEPLWIDVGADEGSPHFAGEGFYVDYVLRPNRPLLLDYGELICAYPRVRLKGSPGATVILTYAEALWSPEGTKGDRNEVAGKELLGYQDKLILDGETRAIEPLWWRTYRYLLIEVETLAPTAAVPGLEAPGGVLLRRIDAIETGYPLQVESSFEAADPLVKPIWDVSVRTAQRCAGETYFDCPYYEQLQYVGDTRIQALIGYYLGRDRALQRNAVETLGWSLMENGLTQSRYPSRQTQVIPPFSLWWVMMVYDQILYDQIASDSLVQKCETVLRISLERKDDPSFWNFVDWVSSWKWGVPTPSTNVLKYQRVLANLCSPATLLFGKEVEDSAHANEFVKEAQDLMQSFVDLLDKTREKLAIDAPRKLADLDFLATREQHEIPTEHGEALYRMCTLVLGSDPLPWPTAALERANAAKCTYYFSYYKHLAMFGQPEHEENPKSKIQNPKFDYMAELAPWKQMIESGLTTFAETPEPTRSDCHAWSAHPILGFFQIVAGVTSTAPGWKKARIMPHPGSLRRFDARIAHPDGELRVKFEKGRLEIDSPVPFELRWKGHREEFKAGKAEA